MKDQLTREQISQIREKYCELFGDEWVPSDLWLKQVVDDTYVTYYATRRFRNRIEHLIAGVLGTWEF